jgi:hypothetical protein
VAWDADLLGRDRQLVSDAKTEMAVMPQEKRRVRVEDQMKALV